LGYPARKAPAWSSPINAMRSVAAAARQAALLAVGPSLRRCYPLRSMATDVEYRDRVTADPYYVSDSPDVTAPGHLYRRFSVGVGSALRVVLPASVSAVDVKVGQLEEIAVQVVSGRKESLGTMFSVLKTDNRVDVTATQAQEQGLEGATVECFVPERFCSIYITAVGAAVHVKSVIEAALKVSSGGGEVALGTIRASDAHVKTGGGALSGSITAYNVGLDTGGGAVRLKRLVGRKVAVESAGGAVDLKVVYGDHVTICSGGGDTTINSMKVSEFGEVHTQGGSFKVLGADGTASVSTDGGVAEVVRHGSSYCCHRSFRLSFSVYNFILHFEMRIGLWRVNLNKPKRAYADPNARGGQGFDC